MVLFYAWYNDQEIIGQIIKYDLVLLWGSGDEKDLEKTSSYKWPAKNASPGHPNSQEEQKIEKKQVEMFPVQS